MGINLPSHQHLMDYHYSHETDDRWCDKCREKISGAAYACLRCELWLHESCAKALEHLPREITHPLHPQHRLTLDWSGFGTTCNKCLKISSSTSYGCCHCDFELDLVCAFATHDHQALKKERSNTERDRQIIQLYSHLHPLILNKYSNIEHDYNCSWCDKPLTGIFYGCKGCEFFIHESCTNKIPKTLNHPFHPSHPLRLQFGNSETRCNACTQIIGIRTGPSTASYFCQECNFNLDFYCAKMLPTLKHKCHDHYLSYFSLTYFRDSKFFKFDFHCNTCHELCVDSFYRCVQCDLNFHFKCVPIPLLAKHKYHLHPLIFKNLIREDDSEKYYCDICEEKRNPTHQVYYCEECIYIAHIECVLNEDETSPGKDSSTAPQSMDLVLKETEQIDTKDDSHHLQQIVVRPWIHEHPLKFYEASEKFEQQCCRACRLEVRGPGYYCEGCLSFSRGFYLHENCVKLPKEIQHPLHSQHRLNLYARFPYMLDFIICDECQDFSPGFFYFCEDCDFKLDLKCATGASPRCGSSISEESDRETELFHFSHKHKLIFCNFRDPMYDRRCSICRLQIFGPTYHCGRCDWFLHESCLRLPQDMKVPFHQQQISVLSSSRYGVCYACALKLFSPGYRRSFNYGCKECHLNFHITCANSISRPLKCESHVHYLYYFGTDFHPFFAMYCDFIDVYAGYFCSHCGEICSGRPFYRCLECSINFHLECLPLPRIVKFKSHIHPLTLKDSFIEDESGENYCDACEEKRHSSDHVYICEECQGLFVGHIECVLATEEEVLSSLVPRERKKRMRKQHLAWRT